MAVERTNRAEKKSSRRVGKKSSAVRKKCAEEERHKTTEIVGVKRRTRAKRLQTERCKEFVQRTVADALPQTMEVFTTKMKKGDVAAFKALWQASGLEKLPVSGRRKKNGDLVQRVLRKIGERGKPGSHNARSVGSD